MAQNGSRNGVKIFGHICLLVLMICKANGFEFKVGGGGDWAVPSDPNTNTYNQWAEKSRFSVGDTLIFNYPADKDSVLLVNKDDYNNCNTASPMQRHSDGNTKFKFDKSGPFYFISGAQDNCKNNEKVVIVVMADRSNNTTNNRFSPSPAAAADNNSPPSPAPAGEEAPPSPPGSVEINPTPAPSQESHPKNNGGSVIVKSGIAASIGALVGYSSFLLF